MMERELEELIEKRKNLIKSFEENECSEGMHKLLTDLYPDTAHFIYELLQNAEDMKATKVRFDLSKKGIKFEHNGTKRSFNISDIKSITIIGNNVQKKDDPTSIGKFGVGFKAVLAYTATPVIHSGQYHFRIENDFVPVFQGVFQVETVDADGTEWTKFEFPFNNPQKPAGIAYKECREGLDELNVSTILFLQNIKEIEYSVPNMQNGYVKRTEDQNTPHIITAIQKRSFEVEETCSNWLRFTDYVDMVDDQGKQKHLSIAAAYALGQDEKTKRNKIVPIQGNTFIYFPAEKEHSGLRFHINAPFASTVARDSVRDCAENTELIKAIAKLIRDSLVEIKKLNLMDFSFFEVLPNNKDQLTPFYQYILDYVVNAFQNNDYLPTRLGHDYVTAKNALSGPPAISSVISGADLMKLFGIKKIWIQNAPQKNSLADNFLQSLGIQSMSYEDFAGVFGVSSKSRIEELLASKDNDWLKRFYYLCVKTHEDLNWRLKSTFIENVRQSRVIKSSKGKLMKADEVFILPPNTSLFTMDTPIVEQSFVHQTSKTDKTADEIRSFFCDELEIQEYGPKVEVEKLLKKYDECVALDDDYFKALLSFADYSSRHDDIEFSKYKLFVYKKQSDRKTYVTRADNLFLGHEYGNEPGDVLANALSKNTLWIGYAEHYNKTELQRFIAFATKCGIKRDLEIVRQSATMNPLYYKELNSDRRYTGYGTNIDYTINDLGLLLDSSNMNEVAKLIWNCLLKSWGKNKYSAYDFTKAYYSPNAQARVKECDSTLIYRLKVSQWVPDNDGHFYKPEDISPSNILKELKYDQSNRLLAALQFGSGATKKSLAKARLEKEAKAEGLCLITEEENREFQEWKAMKKAKQNAEQISPQELLSKQRKKSTPSANAGDDFSSDGSVGNVKRRERNIEASFRDAKSMQPYERKLFARTIESTTEERRFLNNWYQGKCQMCNTRILSYNQSPFFIAKNIIDTRHLSDSIRNTTNLAWNSWCLCPNCAAKYDVCSRDINGLYEQIIQKQVVEGDSESIVLTIELDGKQQEIRYVPKHFLALKKVFELIDKEIAQRE